MYYGSGTVDKIASRLHMQQRVHSPDGSTYLREMTSWPPSLKCDVKSKNAIRNFKNIPAKFHPDTRASPQQEQQQEENE